MARSKGKPSGINKSSGTGTPSNVNPSTEKNDRKITDKYIDEDENQQEHADLKHPNRNVDKGDATNAHGYRN